MSLRKTINLLPRKYRYRPSGASSLRGHGLKVNHPLNGFTVFCFAQQMCYTQNCVCSPDLQFSSLIIIVLFVKRRAVLPPHVFMQFSHFDSVTPWTVAHQSPLSREFPGKNTGVGCHSLLHGISPTQGWNTCLWGLLHWQANSLPLNHLGSLISCPLQSVFPYYQLWWVLGEQTQGIVELGKFKYIGKKVF